MIWRLRRALQQPFALAWTLSWLWYHFYGIRVDGRPDEEAWYFAFGANMHDSAFHERRRMRPIEWRPGGVKGYRLHFNLEGRPRGKAAPANISADPQSEVWYSTKSLSWTCCGPTTQKGCRAAAIATSGSTRQILVAARAARSPISPTAKRPTWPPRCVTSSYYARGPARMPFPSIGFASWRASSTRNDTVQRYFGWIALLNRCSPDQGEKSVGHTVTNWRQMQEEVGCGVI